MDNSFLIRLGLNADEISTGLAKATSSIESFSETIVGLGKTLISAFAIERVAEFGFAVSELAAKAAGVKAAFNELPNSVTLLAEMKDITKDTVSNLDLMGKAVHAENLGIPLQDLGTLLEFVHVRAIATNGDFNSMADILLKSIGRGGAGAKKAMAELQISSEDYTKALKETGNTADAVMKIATDAILKSKTEGLDPTLQAIESTSAAWDNLKVQMGELANSTGVLAAALKFVTTQTKSLVDEVSGWYTATKAILALLKGGATGLSDELAKSINLSKEQNDIWKTGIDIVAKRLPPLGSIKDLEDQIKELTEKKKLADDSDLITINRQLESLKEQLKIKEQLGTQKATPLSAGAIAANNSEIGAMPNVDDNIKKLKEVETTFDSMIMTENDFFEKYKDGFNEIIPPTNAAIIAAKNLHKAHEDLIADEKQLKQTALAVKLISDTVANAVASAISAHQSFASALKGIALAVIHEMEKIAIAEITAAAAKAGAETGNYYVAIAGIIAGVALIESVFSGIGGGGSSGVSASAGMTRSGSPSTSTSAQFSPSQMELSGVFTIKGKDLVAVARTAQHTTSRIGG